VKSVSAVAKRFGGLFTVDSGGGWKGPIGAWKKAGGKVVHLTMYGLPMSEAVPQILEDGSDLLVVVGAEKVPGDLYELADANVAVGNQPHSEVAALALLLDRLRQGAWEADEFPGAKLRVQPSARGKVVEGIVNSCVAGCLKVRPAGNRSGGSLHSGVLPIGRPLF